MKWQDPAMQALPKLITQLLQLAAFHAPHPVLLILQL